MTSPIQILVVGSGRRVRNNFLPALVQLCDRCQVAGVWSRRPEHAARAVRPWGLSTIEDLETALPGVDAVCVSVSTAAVPEVLRRLAPSAPNLTLVLDTPVFGRATHLRSLSLLQRFARVVIAEDYAQFPQWRAVRHAVDAGLIGTVRRVELHHSGFRYHGLALIRSLYGYGFARRVRRHRQHDEVRLEFDFGRDSTGCLIEPYDQARGTTVVVGELGRIIHGPGWEVTDSPVDRPATHAVRLTGGAVPAVNVGGFELTIPDLPALLGAPVPDTSTFNALKTCGLVSVLSSLWEQPPPHPYDYRQALYDHLLTTWLRHVPGAIDPLAAFHRNFVSPLDRVMGLTA